MKPKPQLGFSLIEVMVSLMIIAIGLLGIAKMQSQSIGNMKVSSSRSIAAIHAASMASAMHANKAYWAAGLAPANVKASGSVLSDTTLDGQSVDCVAAGCTPVQLAAFDLRSWSAELARQLPAGTGGVTCSTAVGAVVSCSLSVNWNEKYIAINQTTVDSTQQSATQTLTLLVEP